MVPPASSFRAGKNRCTAYSIFTSIHLVRGAAGNVSGRYPAQKIGVHHSIREPSRGNRLHLGVCGAMEQKSGLGENGKTCIESRYSFLFLLLSLLSPFPLRQARQKNGSSRAKRQWKRPFSLSPFCDEKRWYFCSVSGKINAQDEVFIAAWWSHHRRRGTACRDKPLPICGSPKRSKTWKRTNWTF